MQLRECMLKLIRLSSFSFSFHRLFEENGELLQIFYKFREAKTKEQQMKDEALAKHATTVMETLDEAICSLDKVIISITCPC